MINVTKSWLVEAYIRKGWSQDTIAEKLNTSRRQVRNLLDKYKISKKTAAKTATVKTTAKTVKKATAKTENYSWKNRAWEEARRLNIHRLHEAGLITAKMMKSLMDLNSAYDYVANIVGIPLKTLKKALEAQGITWTVK